MGMQPVVAVALADPATGYCAKPNSDGSFNVTLTAGSAVVGGTYDAGPNWTTSRGVGENNPPFTSADASASAAAVTDAPASGQKLVITDLVVSVDTALTLTFTEETSGYVLLVAHAQPGLAQITLRGKLKLATADKKLMVQASAAGNVAITAFYYSEA